MGTRSTTGLTPAPFLSRYRCSERAEKPLWEREDRGAFQLVFGLLVLQELR